MVRRWKKESSQFRAHSFAQIRCTNGIAGVALRCTRRHRIGTPNNAAKPTTTTTMVLPVVASAARRHVGLMAKQQAQRRTFASAPAQEWEGIDKVVRGYFPEDYQRA
jgi:hypothetical protein